MVFSITGTDQKTKARAGTIQTLHGKIHTPCFIPDATYGAVKHITTEELKQADLQMVLGNIYHKKLGGLHQFMKWEKPIITDSGGFQVFSLVYKNKMGKESATVSNSKIILAETVTT